MRKTNTAVCRAHTLKAIILRQKDERAANVNLVQVGNPENPQSIVISYNRRAYHPFMSLLKSEYFPGVLDECDRVAFFRRADFDFSQTCEKDVCQLALPPPMNWFIFFHNVIVLLIQKNRIDEKCQLASLGLKTWQDIKSQCTTDGIVMNLSTTPEIAHNSTTKGLTQAVGAPEDDSELSDVPDLEKDNEVGGWSEEEYEFSEDSNDHSSDDFSDPETSGDEYDGEEEEQTALAITGITKS